MHGDDADTPRPAGAPGSSFIKAVEVWAPSLDLDELVHVSGYYDKPYAEFGAESRPMRFLFGRGLPGKAWQARRPLVMRADDESFQRCAPALAAGLTCAIAVPIFAGEFLTGVVVFLCGDDEHSEGAIELWQGGDDGVLHLIDGYFGRLHEFEAGARRTTFAQGLGLPGRVWARDRPVLFTDPGRSEGFASAEAVEAFHITAGLGFPVGRKHGPPMVLTLLSASGTPVARVIELWTVVGGELVFAEGYTETGSNLTGWYRGVRVEARSGVLGAALFRGVPVVSEVVTGDVPVALRCHAEVAIPIIRDGECRAVLMFAY